jgi:mannose-6-phosphate isomerase-like protein (cupin superfamily)
VEKKNILSMIHGKINKDEAKGWFCGPWNSELDVSIGYANEGINEKHFHARMNEVYLIAKGSSVAVVNDQKMELAAGDILVVEPGEVHTFISSSPDYMHFVIHTPFVKDDKHSVG